MKHLLLAMTILAATFPACAEEELTEAQQERMNKFLEANPQLRDELKEMEKRNVGVTSFGDEEPTQAEVEAATFQGSAGVAEEAYRRGDYETALQHYKALAAEGDGRASLMIGIMHQQGEGVPEDKAAAYAWYGRAANQKDGTASEIVRGMNDNDELSDKEYKAAEEKYRELTKELDGEEAADQADSKFKDIKDETNVDTKLYVRPDSSR